MGRTKILSLLLVGVVGFSVRFVEFDGVWAHIMPAIIAVAMVCSVVVADKQSNWKLTLGILRASLVFFLALLLPTLAVVIVAVLLGYIAVGNRLKKAIAEINAALEASNP